MAESEEELKNLLMKVKEENGKSWLKTQMFKKLRSWHHFMANRWGKWKQWHVLFPWAPKSLQMVTATMKLRHLLLGRKAMSNLDNVLKSKDIILLTKVHIVKAMAFPVVMHR